MLEGVVARRAGAVELLEPLLEGGTQRQAVESLARDLHLLARPGGNGGIGAVFEPAVVVVHLDAVVGVADRLLRGGRIRLRGCLQRRERQGEDEDFFHGAQCISEAATSEG